MRTIAILNLKGGVGKTVTAINFAAILALDYAQRVLLVDADSQANLTEFVGGDSAVSNLADVLRGDAPAVASIQKSAMPGVDILPGSDALMDLDLTKVELQAVSATVLRDMVAYLDEAKAYDACVIDCPPAFNAAAAAALIAADDVLIPIKVDAFSLRGMANVLRQVRNMQEINPRLRVAGVLPTMYYRSSKEYESAIRELCLAGLRVFPSIRRSDRVDDSTFAQDALLTFSPRSAAAVDYRRFVETFLRGGVLHG